MAVFAAGAASRNGGFGGLGGMGITAKHGGLYSSTNLYDTRTK